MFGQFSAGRVNSCLVVLELVIFFFFFAKTFKATPFNRINEGLISKFMVFLRRLVYHKGKKLNCLGYYRRNVSITGFFFFQIHRFRSML